MTEIDAVDEKMFAAPVARVPPETRIPPVAFMVLASVSVPAPDFVRFPAPLMVPAKVWLPVSATVSVALAAIDTAPPERPPPWRDPIVSLF